MKRSAGACRKIPPVEFKFLRIRPERSLFKREACGYCACIMGRNLDHRVSLVVAAADNGVIGHRGELPWHIPADLKHFRAVTMGKPIIMGRKTFESIGKPLPGRDNIVITRNPEYEAPAGIHLAGSLDQALALAANASDIMVIGGAEIYSQALDHADRIYLTEVHSEPPGDTYLPNLKSEEWIEIDRADHPGDADQPAFSFVILDRQPSS